jgi:hypothetical protein
MPANAIFISYSRESSEFVEKLVTFFHDASIKVWLDKDKMVAGDPWDESVKKGILEADEVLLIMCKDSINSDIVKAEYTFALDNDKKVIPIKLEECDVPLRLHPFHYIDFSVDAVKGRQELIKALNLSKKQTNKLNKSKVFLPKKRTRTKLKFFVFLVLLVVVLWNFKEDWIPWIYSETAVSIEISKGNAESVWIRPSAGKIILKQDGDIIRKNMNKLGATSFTIPPNFIFFKGDSTKIEFKSQDPFYKYQLVHKNVNYNITKDSTFALELALIDVLVERAKIIDSETKSPLSAVNISYLNHTHESKSDGTFNLIVPQNIAFNELKVTVSKAGYQRLQLDSISIPTDSIVTIALTPIVNDGTDDDLLGNRANL